MPTPIPLTIAGGGLTGLSLAIGLLERGIPVRVVEAGRYPRHRVCGEFISGVSDQVLENLGIAPMLGDAGRPSSVSLLERGRAVWSGTLPMPARAISRYRLDDRLQQHFTAMGGVLATRQRVQPSPHQEGLVWAAGRRPQPGQWIGLKCHVRLELKADLEMHLGDGGYVGLNQVEDDWVNLCGLFRLNRSWRGQGSALLESYLRGSGFNSLATRLRGVPLREHSFCSVAGFALGRQPHFPGCLSVGDADLMIPPLTGNGMSMALEAASWAIDPLDHWANQRLSWAQTIETIRLTTRRKFRVRMAVGQLFHHTIFQPELRGAVLGLARFGLFPFNALQALVRE